MTGYIPGGSSAHLSDVRFSILGPVRAWRGNAELDLGPPTRQALLALLLAAGGQPVAMSAIIDVLWGDDAPNSAVNLVHRHVGVLRRLVQPGLPNRTTGGVILPGSGGYRMIVDSNTLDLLRFRLVHQHAVRAADDGDAALATELFAEALALWRGQVAAGVPDRIRTQPAFLAVAREQLVAARRAATVALASPPVSRDIVTDIVTGIQRLADVNPLDEDLHAALIRLLAAAGQQADALATYRTMRERLADELGIDPGTQLRAARDQVLLPPPAPAPAAPVPAPRVVPAQLPADLAAFTGRAAELARERDLLSGVDTAPVITTIVGMAGVGKTTLAVRLAHDIAEHFPDGQLYVNLRGFDPTESTVEPDEALRGFLEALGVAAETMPSDPDARVGLYRSLLTGRRVLVLLDNARDAEAVRPLLPGTAGCMTIVTSRRRLRSLVAQNGAHPLTLGLLSVAESEEFLVHRLGADRIGDDRTVVDQIITKCARLPLALAVVAARVATNQSLSLADVATDLSGEGTLADPEGELDVRNVFSWSCSALRPPTRRLFRLLGQHPGPELSVPAVASMAALPPPWTRALLDELASVHLLDERSPGRYALHDLLFAYAKQLADSEPDAARHDARHRLLDHYLHGAIGVMATLFPYHTRIPVDPPLAGVVEADLGSHQRAQTWLRKELPVLFSIVTQADDTDFAGYSWRTAAVLELVLDRKGRWSDQVIVQRAGLTSASRDGDRFGVATTSRALGFAYGRIGDQRRAEEHLYRALRLFGEIGDRDGLGATSRNLAFLANMRGEYRHALNRYDDALTEYRLTDNRNGEAAVLNEIGWTLIMLGDHAGALDHCRRSIALHVATGNRNGEAAASDSLGYAYHHLGRYDRAIAHFQDALRIYRDIGDRYLEADTLGHIGQSAAASDDLDTARRAWDDGLDILNELGHPDAATILDKRVALDRTTRQRPVEHSGPRPATTK
ncbi:MAG TPA: BTAD domain-containing putative transcriptional regulator [Pseudonocardiaceae bacterium]|jgi:DNA-binding SARP family transcriptional activator/tetratricopeptide (TPR) repeat protein|nr:BTAD domain-containing putative transcriptional regulator [Pseudonocardiaceae bacterium]